MQAEKNALDPLSYGWRVHLESVHDRKALSYVKGFLNYSGDKALKVGGYM